MEGNTVQSYTPKCCVDISATMEGSTVQNHRLKPKEISATMEKSTVQNHRLKPKCCVEISATMEKGELFSEGRVKIGGTMEGSAV
jgi:hypothetical protein